MDEFQSVMEEESRTHPPLWDIHLGEPVGPAECSALEAIPSFYFYWKRYDLWKPVNFSGNTDLGHVFMFSPNFYKDASSLWCFPDQSIQAAKSLGHPSFLGQDPLPVSPEGRMRLVAHHLIAPGAWSPHPGGHPLPMSMSQVQGYHTVMLVSLWCASLLEGLEDTGQSVNRLLWWEGGGEESGRRAEPDLVGLHLHAMTLTCWFPMVHPPCNLTCWFPHGVDSHCFPLFSWGFQAGLYLPPYSWGSCEFTQFSMTFFLSSLVPKIASSDVQSAIWYQRCELSTQTINWQEEELAHVSGESFLTLLLHESASRLNSRWQ